MIFQTQNQLNTFLIILFFGLICCLFFNFIKTIFLISFTKKFKKILFCCIFYSIFACFFIFLLIFFNFGIFNISLLLAFILGFIWCNFLFKNLVVFLENKWYTTYNKIKISFKDTNASKSKKS